MSPARRSIGKVGVWSLELRYGDRSQARDAAGELEALGYDAIWIPGGVGGNLTSDIDSLLDATGRATIATGVLNIWKHDPTEIAAWWRGLPQNRKDRTLLGLGVSHSHVIGQAFKPVTAMRDYLDRLVLNGVNSSALCLAALGPKMLDLARERTAGAHPYLITPQHTANARSSLGPGALLAPEQGFVLHADRTAARELARGALAHYKDYPNYRRNWHSLGFSEGEMDSLSDRLVDELFACGPAEVVKERVDAHFAAGADHVCLQPVTGKAHDIQAALQTLRELAPAVIERTK